MILYYFAAFDVEIKILICFMQWLFLFFRRTIIQIIIALILFKRSQILILIWEYVTFSCNKHILKFFTNGRVELVRGMWLTGSKTNMF